MVEFNLFKIPVRVEASFWIIMALFGFMWNQGEQSSLFLNIALFVIAAFISILVHELGHAMMIRKYKLPTQIVLSSFGGYASHPAGYFNRMQSFLVTLAGPLLQATLGVALLFALPHLGLPDSKLDKFFDYLIIVSIGWAILNCLPVLPLDGGRMLEAILGPKRLKITIIVSLVTATAIAILGFATGQLFIAIIMAMFAWQNYQALDHYKGR